MRIVVDSNFLQSERLRKYLSKSPANYAVLTDYAAMEAYKGNTLASIYLSMEILSQFPNQVIILKGTPKICGLKPRNAGLHQRMIDARQTAEFSDYCKKLKAARNGDRALEEALLHHGREATCHMDRMLADAVNIPSVFAKVAGIYTGTELKIFRTDAHFSDDVFYKFIWHVMVIAAFFFRDHPKVKRLPNFSELPNAFIFRSALCAHLLFIEWVSVGSPSKIKPERMRNDLVDINFAAYATYFDGLFTEDRKLNRLYKDATAVLERMKRLA